MLGKHNVTTETPKNVLLGAGTYHKGLHWDSSSKKWAFESTIGATNGGGKIAINGELLDLELDGALVSFKGQTVKVGGEATMEVNMAELTVDNLKMAGRLTEGDSDADGYTMLIDKPNIEEGDYLENFGFVGKTANGAKDIIVIFENGLCTSALELEPKNKEQAVLKATIKAYAEIDGNLDTLPVKIYYPGTATV